MCGFPSWNRVPSQHTIGTVLLGGMEGVPFLWDSCDPHAREPEVEAVLGAGLQQFCLPTCSSPACRLQLARWAQLLLSSCGAAAAGRKRSRGSGLPSCTRLTLRQGLCSTRGTCGREKGPGALLLEVSCPCWLLSISSLPAALPCVGQGVDASCGTWAERWQCRLFCMPCPTAWPPVLSSAFNSCWLHGWQQGCVSTVQHLPSKCCELQNYLINRFGFFFVGSIGGCAEMSG